MANEIHVDYESGSTLYFVRHNAAGKVALSDGSSFEDWGSGSPAHDADDYDVALTENGTAGGHYVGDFDSAGSIAAGRYTIQVFLQLGSLPADSDTLLYSGEILWTGTGELTVDKVLTNKAVQNKTTGVIDYYDDDNATVILTHTPSDGESTITRMPS